MRKQKGFSLIELLIVVAIILIIAAIAIPNLLRSRMSANEASAVASLRTYNTAMSTYQSNYNVYASTFTALGPASGAPTSGAASLVDNVLGCPAGSSCTKSGYSFVLGSSDGGATTFNIVAGPVTQYSTGIRGFYTDQSYVIRANATGPTASATDNVLGN